MAIQRMYTGRGGAVQFDKPAITPTEISQQYGRSMTDILKFKQTMQQRRRENVEKLSGVTFTEGLMGEAQARQAERMDVGKQAIADILAAQAEEGGDPYDLSTARRAEIERVKTGITGEGDRELAVQKEFIKAQRVITEDAAKEQPKFDQDFYIKAVEYMQANEGKYPPGGFIKERKLDTSTLLGRGLSKIKRVGTGKLTSEIVGGAEIMTEEQVWDDAAIKEKVSQDYWSAPNLIDKEWGGIEGYEEAVREELGEVQRKKAYKTTLKKDDELGKIRSVPGGSTNPDYKVMPGGEEVKRVVVKGEVNEYDTKYTNEIQGFKGDVTLSAGATLQTTDIKIPGIEAGEVLGEKMYRKGDEIKGESLVNHSFKVVQPPAVTGYPTASEDIVVYEKDKKGEVEKNILGKKKEKFSVKAGQQVTRKQFEDMDEKQRILITTKPFVDLVVHFAANKNITVSEPLTKAWKRKLALSDEVYNNYLKGYSAEGAAEEGVGLRADGTKKDIGYLGELQLPDGRSATEYSVGVTFDGKETEIPTLIPTLTETEIHFMVNDIIPNNKEVPQAILNKAITHAKKRIKEGKSPFYSKGEGETGSRSSVYNPNK